MKLCRYKELTAYSLYSTLTPTLVQDSQKVASPAR